MISVSEAENIILTKFNNCKVNTGLLYNNLYVFSLGMKNSDTPVYGPCHTVDVNTGKYMGTLLPHATPGFKEEAKVLFNRLKK